MEKIEALKNKIEEMQRVVNQYKTAKNFLDRETEELERCKAGFEKLKAIKHYDSRVDETEYNFYRIGITDMENNLLAPRLTLEEDEKLYNLLYSAWERIIDNQTKIVAKYQKKLEDLAECII